MNLPSLQLACCVLLLTGGCGDSSQYRGETSPPLMAQIAAPAPGNGAAVPMPAAVQHKIIHTANLQLVVDDFSVAATKITKLVDQVQGYVANSSVDGSTGRHRNGTWKVRIPVPAYDKFLQSVETFGELQNLSTDSQDVTAEFYDLEARIKNKLQEEARLLKHLEQSTGKLDEILNVEKELSRVREEIERMQGRRAMLQDLTAMTTVTVHVTEIHGFLPAVAPTFAVRVSRAFFGSLDGLRQTATEVFLVVVALSPWLIVLGTAALFAWALRRIVLRRPIQPNAIPR